MKVRIKPSGRIAEIESMRIKGSNRTYYPQELDILPIEQDWQQVRIQAAIANAAAMANDMLTKDFVVMQLTTEYIAKQAVQLADTLVEQLKKGGEHD